MKIVIFSVGDVLQLRKNHPCGQKHFKVLRTGSDVRLCCVGCGRDLVIPREKLDRMIVRVINSDDGIGSQSKQ